jgi:hypothetical protein
MAMAGAQMAKYVLDGDIRDTEIEGLARALAGPEWTVTNRGDELELEADDLVIDIYDHAPDRNGRQFLISGQLKRNLAEVKSLLAVLGARLRAHRVPYRLALSDEQGNQVDVVSHLGDATS